MNATGAYFVGIFIGCVLTVCGSALWKAAEYKERQHLQREAAKRRYRLEQRMNQRETNHRHDHRH
jgi:hypothetical protein